MNRRPYPPPRADGSRCRGVGASENPGRALALCGSRNTRPSYWTLWYRFPQRRMLCRLEEPAVSTPPRSGNLQ